MRQIWQKRILDTYVYASKKWLVYKKYEIFFSRNVAPGLKNTLSNILQVTKCIDTDKYLGLLSMIGRGKKLIFNYNNDWVLWRHILCWISKMLSQARKASLIKLVAQAIISYCMSVFLLPNSIEEEILKKNYKFL